MEIRRLTKKRSSVIVPYLTKIAEGISKHRSGRWGALDAHKRGGRSPKLDIKAMRWIYRTVTTKNLLQMKFPFALWAAKMIGWIVDQHCGVKLSKASVCRLLAQLGFGSAASGVARLSAKA